MAETSPNLLSPGTSKPNAGIQTGNIITWYGGAFACSLGGVFDGATVDILASVKFPASGKKVDFSALDADWFPLFADVSQPDTLRMDNLNPCAIALRIKTPGNNTRINSIVQ